MIYGKINKTQRLTGLVRVFALLNLVLAPNAVSSIAAPWTLDEWVRFSDFVGTIRILEVDELGGTDQTMRCGVLVRAEVIESFKGPSRNLRFYLSNRDDLLPGHDRYLLFAGDVSGESGGERKPILQTCGVSNVQWFVRNEQSMFAFGTEEDQWIDSSFVLEGREGIFSFNHYLGQSEYVQYFVVIQDRIFAAIEWAHLRDAILLRNTHQVEGPDQHPHEH